MQKTLLINGLKIKFTIQFIIIVLIFYEHRELLIIEENH